jgi:hypothetical protein
MNSLSDQEFGLLLKDDKPSHDALTQTVQGYYRSNGDECFKVGTTETITSTIGGKTQQDGYSQQFFIKRKYFIIVQIPIDTRNFFQSISLGVGGGFAPMYWLLTQASQDKLSMSPTTEGVIQNLQLLDLYLGGKLQ